MADSKSWFLLGGLYMAPFPQYAEYELRNSNAYARRFPLLVPYVGEVADSDADETGENTQNRR